MSQDDAVTEAKTTEENGIAEKLKIQIPVISFSDISLEEAIDFLRIRSVELDMTEGSAQKGINFVLPDFRGRTKEIRNTGSTTFRLKILH